MPINEFVLADMTDKEKSQYLKELREYSMGCGKYFEVDCSLQIGYDEWLSDYEGGRVSKEEFSDWLQHHCHISKETADQHLDESYLNYGTATNADSDLGGEHSHVRICKEDLGLDASKIVAA